MSCEPCVYLVVTLNVVDLEKWFKVFLKLYNNQEDVGIIMYKIVTCFQCVMMSYKWKYDRSKKIMIFAVALDIIVQERSLIASLMRMRIRKIVVL